jgi:hypothetical protein
LRASEKLSGALFPCRNQVISNAPPELRQGPCL